MYRLSCLGSSVLETDSRAVAAAEAKATAARRGHSVIVTVLQAGANPHHLIYFPDGSLVPAFSEDDETLYRGNRQLLQQRIDCLRKRADLLTDHAARVCEQLPCAVAASCRDCRSRGLCDVWARALSKKANLEWEILELYRMRRAMHASRKAVRS